MPGRVMEDRSTSGHGLPIEECGATNGPSDPTDRDPCGMDEPPGIRRLYTAGMIADVLGVAPAAIRHWVRGRLLQPVRRAGSLEWFDFPQLVAGRHLARLLTTGMSLRDIDRQLAGFTAGDMAAAAAVAERVVADGRRLSIRSGERLLGPGGQMQFGFYSESFAELAPRGGEAFARTVAGDTGWRSERSLAGEGESEDEESSDDGMAGILDLADDLEAAGEFLEAAEAVRAVLQARGPSAEVTFTLAELLYRAGDLTAARERYYAVIEIDPGHLRARTCLGCVLAELDDHELALAALEGVLRQEPDYADAHWHVAGILAEMGRADEGRHHLARFLDLSPESPWAELARQRLAVPPPSQ
jgi:DNA-binding transcriptional MerR regulator